ncbi:hypothetical protein PV326_013796, partial [Microctonus aethiopoides]
LKLPLGVYFLPLKKDKPAVGELYVEDLGERRIVSIRMGWLWVEGTPMRLALRALNLRQASSGLCQPHALALGFNLSNSKGDPLATFWADNEANYWSWVRAIAAELVRQTPFRAQRCLNFLEILTICPRGSLQLPDSPPDSRRRSRSELRCWLGESPLSKDIRTTTILEDSRRRARSELRCWSSSNSSDDDLINEFQTVTIPQILPKMQSITRAWGCSESSEGSDDSLPWMGNNSTSILSTITLPEAPTREQRIQRYKEARRRENEARTRRVLEEDAKKRRARTEENNNEILQSRYLSSRIKTRFIKDNNDDDELLKIKNNKSIDIVDSINLRLPPIKPVDNSHRIKFHQHHLHHHHHHHQNIEDTRNNNNLNRNNISGINLQPITTTNNCSTLRYDTSSERRSRARERRNLRIGDTKINQDYNEKLNSNITNVSKIPISCHQTNNNISTIITKSIINSIQSPIKIDTRERFSTSLPRVSTSPTVLLSIPPDNSSTSCEEDVARLLKRCQRVDHYVPVKEKLTLFESLSRMGGRLARSTEDLGRPSAKPSSPRGKQRARSLHDLNRGAKTVPVREMCRLFEANNHQDLSLNYNNKREQQPQQTIRNNIEPPCVRASTRRKHYQK